MSKVDLPLIVCPECKNPLSILQYINDDECMYGCGECGATVHIAIHINKRRNPGEIDERFTC